MNAQGAGKVMGRKRGGTCTFPALTLGRDKKKDENKAGGKKKNYWGGNFKAGSKRRVKHTRNGLSATKRNSPPIEETS